MEKDLYEVLQVQPIAEPEVIEAAYRTLARKYHPDVNGDPQAAERMRDLNAAYEVLRDPIKRMQYDRSREPQAAAATRAPAGAATGAARPAGGRPAGSSHRVTFSSIRRAGFRPQPGAAPGAERHEKAGGTGATAAASMQPARSRRPMLPVLIALALVVALLGLAFAPTPPWRSFDWPDFEQWLPLGEPAGVALVPAEASPEPFAAPAGATAIPDRTAPPMATGTAPAVPAGAVTPPASAPTPARDGARPLVRQEARDALADPRLASLAAKGLPLMILVPPANLAPFDRLVFANVEWGTGAFAQTQDAYRLRYRQPGGSGTATLAGVYRSVPAEVERIESCTPDGAYCRFHVEERPATGAAPTGELFRSLFVGEAAATVVHRTCCNGDSWSVSWYDAAAQTGYILTFEQAVDPRFGTQLSQDNLAAARTLTRIAEQLAVLPKAQPSATAAANATASATPSRALEEPPYVFSGTADLRTEPFRLRAGGATIRWRATSVGTAACELTADLVAQSGAAPAHRAVTVEVRAANQTLEDTATVPVLAAGDYLLDVRSSCVWQLTVEAQP